MTQNYFDQGVRLLFNFNHAEAIRSFREAARLDPKCAMCWWGVAYALGPNINLPMQADANTPAWEATQKAMALRRHASPRERAYIEAMAKRYTPNAPADRKPLDEAFAAAMGDVVRAYPGDLDAATFYAEAMMDTQPWAYWEPDGTTPKGHALKIVATLEDVIRRAPNHPGALHLYIHAVEASTTPERAEAVADRLTMLMPKAGHIVHMPSHIYYRVGRYGDANAANEKAASADEAYIASCRAQGFYPAAYYVHNIHFLWTSYEMEGRYRDALSAARRVVKASPPEFARPSGTAQLFFITPMMTHVRFGKWDAVLTEPAADPQMKLAGAFHTFARGVAYAKKGQLARARAARNELAALPTSADITALADAPSAQLIEIAVHVLEGEIALAQGKPATAVSAFQRAKHMEHNLPYMEPPYWHQPVSHLLGDALLRAGRPKQAEDVYRASLKVFRRDGLALIGLSRALAAQGKNREAREARRQYDEVWANADARPATSRF
jgi:tetratricopeptide (TPR) repeat protein